MSINTAHTENNGVIIHYGELVLLFSENVTVEFPGHSDPLFKATKQGKIYFTTHRLIFTSTNLISDPMKSFSFPFICLQEIEIDRPLLSANNIRGKVTSQSNGNFFGEVKFKIVFQSGGETVFGQALLHAIGLARKNSRSTNLPPYTPPTDELLQAPPTLYTSNDNPVWLTRAASTVFPKKPNPGTIYMDSRSPPYSGIVSDRMPFNQDNEQPTQSTSQNAFAVRNLQSSGYCNYIPEQPLEIHPIVWDIEQPQTILPSTAQSTPILLNQSQRSYPFSQRLPNVAASENQNIIQQGNRLQQPHQRPSAIRPNAPSLDNNGSSNSNDSPPSYDSLFSTSNQ